MTLLLISLSLPDNKTAALSDRCSVLRCPKPKEVIQDYLGTVFCVSLFPFTLFVNRITMTRGTSILFPFLIKFMNEFGKHSSFKSHRNTFRCIHFSHPLLNVLMRLITSTYIISPTLFTPCLRTKLENVSLKSFHNNLSSAFFRFTAEMGDIVGLILLAVPNYFSQKSNHIKLY
jgi:hypothetical protein